MSRTHGHVPVCGFVGLDERQRFSTVLGSIAWSRAVDLAWPAGATGRDEETT
jgi:hypothetical protein